MLLERFGACLDCPEAYLERFRPCLERSAACLDHSGACLERSEASLEHSGACLERFGTCLELSGAYLMRSGTRSLDRGHVFIDFDTSDIPFPDRSYVFIDFELPDKAFLPQGSCFEALGVKNPWAFDPHMPNPRQWSRFRALGIR